jgi:ubiquinone/menaquinone biosynthesis C-methylase UbiE
MKVAQELGYKVTGIEVSDYAGNYTKKRFGKESVLIGNIEEIKLPENYFSIVSLIEVLEHILDFRKALNNIISSMKRGAVIVIQTADMDGLQARLFGPKYHYYLPGHLSYFSRTTLTILLKSIGFRKIKFIGGVEFSLFPKLIKSKSGFKKWTDYFKWIKISIYHLLSRIAIGRFHLTSSMVVAAWK